MTKRLIIADRQLEYIERLKAYIDRKYPSYYEIEAFCNKEELRERLQSETCEVCLFSKQMYDTLFSFKHVKLPILLEEESRQASYPEKIKWSIPKYSRISTMIQYIEAQYMEVERNRPLVYSFYAPAGGVGKTTIALGTALSYAQAGRKVFYINLEDWDSTGLFFNRQSKEVALPQASLGANSDFYLLQKNMRQDLSSQMMYWLRTTTEVDQALLECLPKFIEALIESETAQIIVLDLSQDYAFLKERLAKLSDYIMLVSDTRTHSNFKMKQFLEKTDIMNVCKDKLRWVLNQGQETSLVTALEVTSRIETLYASDAFGLCETIATNKLLKLHGLTE